MANLKNGSGGVNLDLIESLIQSDPEASMLARMWAANPKNRTLEAPFRRRAAQLLAENGIDPNSNDFALGMGPGGTVEASESGGIVDFLGQTGPYIGLGAVTGGALMAGAGGAGAASPSAAPGVTSVGQFPNVGLIGAGSSGAPAATGATAAATGAKTAAAAGGAAKGGSMGFKELAGLAGLSGGINLAAGLLGGEEELDNRIPFEGVDLNKQMQDALSTNQQLGKWAVQHANKPVQLRSSFAQSVPGLSGVDPALSDPSLLRTEGAGMPDGMFGDEVTQTLKNFLPKPRK